MIFPFRGIDTRRPYPPTGLTTKRWVDEVVPRLVFFDELFLTQEHLRVAGIFGVTNAESANDPVPHAVLWRDVLYLEDGHHRIMRDALSGKRAAYIRVYEVEKK